MFRYKQIPQTFNCSFHSLKFYKYPNGFLWIFFIRNLSREIKYYSCSYPFQYSLRNFILQQAQACTTHFYLKHMWRIQDFLVGGGAPIPEEGVTTCYWTNFSQKMHENDENLVGGGGSKGRAANEHYANRNAYQHCVTHHLIL